MMSFSWKITFFSQHRSVSDTRGFFDSDVFKNYPKFAMQKACLISFLMIFTLGVVSAGFTTHSFGCTGVDTHSVEKTYKPRSGEVSISSSDFQSFHSENADSSNGPIHSTDCNCPTHRTHCCSPLVMLDRIERPQFISSKAPQKFFEKTYSVKQAPHLEGPFQPPRV